MADESAMKKVTLERAGESFTFSWRDGGEQAVADQVAAAARDPSIAFDWFDAALVLGQIERKSGGRFVVPKGDANG